jgi:RHS repeat-associated protein
VYFWGKRSSDDLVSKRSRDLTQSPAATRWWHFVTDHQFSVRAVIDGSSKAVHERAEYDAHGRPRLWLGADIFPVDDPDGQLNAFDYSRQYINWFNAQDPRADLNGDGTINFYDLAIYGGMYNSQQYGGGGGSLSDANPSGPMNVIGFAGYHWDEELGLWLSRHRVYDPELGRWIQRDPAGYIDGLSLYLYVSGNPFSLVDPTGLFWESVKHAAISVGSGVKELYGGSIRRSVMAFLKRQGTI